VNLRRALVPVVLATVATLAACGGNDSGGSASDDKPTASQSQSTATPSADDPGGDSGDAAACDLLTTDEVAAAVGSPVKAGVASSGPAVTGGSFTTCVWQSDDPDNPADTATVTVYPNADAADSAREDDSQDVSGIGDKAFTGSFASMWVYVGEKSFFAQWYAFGGTDEESMPKSQALAKAVVGAL
jgi:hypothetical protein